MLPERLSMSNMLPSPDVLNNEEYGKFVLSNLAAKRAKQLKEGAPPLVSVESGHPLTIALAEIAAGKIKPILGTAEEAAMLGEGAELATVTEELLAPEFGMLLPALDETEAALIESPEIVGADHETESEHEGEEAAAPVSLSDLVDEEAEEAAPPIGEEETLSLTDIAEQESGMDEEDQEE
jgi:DNA-directed RNA polymerase subunit omega